MERYEVVDKLNRLSDEDLEWLGSTVNSTLEERSARKRRQDWDNLIKALKTYVDNYGTITVEDGLDCRICLNHSFSSCPQSETIYGF